MNKQESNKTRLYEGLGQVVVSFNALELAIEGIIFCGLQVPATQLRILMGSMAFATKVTTMNSVIRELHTGDDLGSLGITLDEFVERCHFCEEQRNQWVRSYWVPELEAELGQMKRLQHPLPGQGQFFVDAVNLQELEHFIVCLNTTVTYLYRFHQKLCTSFGRMRDSRSLNEYLRTPIQAGNDA